MPINTANHTPYFSSKALLAIILLCLSGCSQKFQDTNATIKEAWAANTDAQISSEQIQQLPYASIFLRINNGPQLFLALAFVDQNKTTHNKQLKWLSADKGMIVTENGRIVKTTGFLNNNLASLRPQSSTQVASLRYMGTNNNVGNWIYDWQPHFRYNFTAKVSQTNLGYDTLTTSLWSKKVHHIQERVRFDTLQVSIHNDYWIDKNNQTVKTIQYIGPNMDKVEITFIKPYAGASEEKEDSQ